MKPEENAWRKGTLRIVKLWVLLILFFVAIIMLHLYQNKFHLNKYKSDCSEYPALLCMLSVLFLESHLSTYFIFC